MNSGNLNKLTLVYGRKWLRTASPSFRKMAGLEIHLGIKKIPAFGVLLCFHHREINLASILDYHSAPY